MAGKMKGWAPKDLRNSAAAFKMTAMLATPRLPAVRATRCPGLTDFSRVSFFNSALTVPGRSATWVRSKVWRRRYTFGKFIFYLLLERRAHRAYSIEHS